LLVPEILNLFPCFFNILSSLWTYGWLDCMETIDLLEEYFSVADLSAKSLMALLL
jgi:hypothetical protein